MTTAYILKYRNIYIHDGDVVRLRVIRRDGTDETVTIDRDDMARVQLHGPWHCVSGRGDFPYFANNAHQTLARLIARTPEGEQAYFVSEDRYDYRKANLKSQTHLDGHQQIKTKRNKTGHQNVYETTCGKFWVGIIANERPEYGGVFDTLGEAVAARDVEWKRIGRSPADM